MDTNITSNRALNEHGAKIELIHVSKQLFKVCSSATVNFMDIGIKLNKTQ